MPAFCARNFSYFEEFDAIAADDEVDRIPAGLATIAMKELLPR